MKTPLSDEELKFLELLKARELLSHRQMSGDDISHAERLVDLKLASKVSTKVDTFYFYGYPNGAHKHE